MPAADKLKRCLLEGKQGGERHQGVRKVAPSLASIQGHLAKARHNLEAVTAFNELHYSDWSANAAFYALYHGLLAILAQHGYESRNQSCTFAFIEDLLSRGALVNLTSADLKEIFDRNVTTDLLHSDKILDIRERMQYSTHTTLVEEEFQLLKKRTKQILDKILLDLERSDAA